MAFSDLGYQFSLIFALIFDRKIQFNILNVVYFVWEMVFGGIKFDSDIFVSISSICLVQKRLVLVLSVFFIL